MAPDDPRVAMMKRVRLVVVLDGDWEQKFGTVAELQTRLLQFIRYCNRQPTPGIEKVMNQPLSYLSLPLLLLLINF